MQKALHLGYKLSIMKLLFKLLGLLTLFICSAFFISSSQKPVMAKPAAAKIQVAILLDVSGSMDGLIEQAKAQLWNMVNTMGKAKCSGELTPAIEIALYEYGRPSNDVKKGYVKQINGFINDMDSLSQNLFSLKTDGGDEYCGHVIFSSLNELKWDMAPENYKVIFIAGNEDFLQGDIKYTQSCSEAKNKNVIVNTIYCGDKMQGIREHWNLAGECGNGSYTNINQDAKMEEIPTPYDSMLYVMNGRLNTTYVSYGFNGASYQAKQVTMDVANASMSKEAQLKRIKTKSNAKVYKNDGWDLVDAEKEGKLDFKKLDKNTLADSLRNKTDDQLEKIIAEKSKERSATQQSIDSLNIKRDAYIAVEKAKKAKSNAPTLETEVERIIKEQARRYNMIIQ
jgi:hypothetical protein